MHLLLLLPPQPPPTTTKTKTAEHRKLYSPPAKRRFGQSWSGQQYFCCQVHSEVTSYSSL